MKVSLSGDKLAIKFPYAPSLVSLVRQLDGRQYLPQQKAWTIPIAGARPALVKLARQAFHIDPAAWEAVTKAEQEGEALALLAGQPDAEFKTELPLFGFQKTGAAFLSRIGSGLLGDEVGLGKTCMALAVVEQAQAEKVLVVCPAILKWQWESEIRKFLDGQKVCVVEGNAGQRLAAIAKNNYRFLIINYELLIREDFRYLSEIEWDYIIADEATRISNPFAKQSKAIKRLQAKRRLALTGTPVSNRANELWNILDFTNPGVLGSYASFIERYCVKNHFGGIVAYRDMELLKQRIRRYMIRRLKSEVYPELPEKIVSEVPFQLSERERELYRKLQEEILYEIEHTDISKIEDPTTIQLTLTKLLRLSQLCDSMELLGEEKKSTKLEVLKELLNDILNGEKKALLFTRFSKMADILERELAGWGALKITGEVPQEERESIIQTFNGGDMIHRILISTEAGQYGLNLQAASVIFHYDEPFSLAKLQQREGRAHRIGQKETVLCYHLLAKGTVDYHTRKILHSKQKISDELLGDPPMTMSDIRQLLKYE